MAPSSSNPVLHKKTKVVAATDLVGVPIGTPGKVVLVNGLTWIRYWVRFENGITMGSINRSALATTDEWQRHLSGDVGATTGAVTAASAEAADGGDDGGAGATTPSGTVVPSRLIERSRAARARLAA